MVYVIVRFLTNIYLSLFHRIIYIGRENIPVTGPLLIYSNHPSAFDMFLLGSRIKRRIHFMAKAELFENPFLSWFFTEMGAFPVHRGKGDTGSVKTALRILEEGGTVGIFPEGTRTQKKNTDKKKGGAALIAYHSDAPILPVAIEGRYRIFKKIRIIYGEPFHFDKNDGERPDREDLYEATRKIMNRIYALMGQ